MQKYTDSTKRELISSRDNHKDCASMFCFVKVSGLLYDFFKNVCSIAMMGKNQGNIQNHCLNPKNIFSYVDV